MAEDAQVAGIQNPVVPGLPDEQQEHEEERPLYITTASPYIEEADTKYQWIKAPPIICIGLSDIQLDEEVQLQLAAQPPIVQAQLRKYYYLAATLTKQETVTYNKQASRNQKQAYLQLLVDTIEQGTRPMYLYQPIPKTLEDKIAAMCATQENSPHAAALRAAMPLKIPTRVISADQVQMELNQQSEEELQETLADMQRAISLGDPDVKPDSVVLARFLSKNKLLGEVVNKMSGLGTNNETNPDSQHNLTVLQKTTLDGFINAPPAAAAAKPDPTSGLNLSSFEVTLPNGDIMKGLGGEISDIWQGPDALSHFLIGRLLTQNPKARAEALPVLVPNPEHDQVDIFEEWALNVHRCQPHWLYKKDVLWQQIRKHSDFAIQLLDCEMYSKDDDFSFIRLVYECRKRLNRHSHKSDLARRYTQEKQKPGEKATDFITRLTNLRTKAFGKKDAKGLWTFENAWIHHLDTALWGFLNKQLVAKVNEANPQDAAALYEATKQFEETLNRNVKFGATLGLVDNRALVGLDAAGQEPSKQNSTGVQAMGPGQRPSKCMKCGDRKHKTDACSYPTRVCFYCKQSDHSLANCPTRPPPKQGSSSRSNSARPAATPQIREMSAISGNQESSPTWVGFQEGSL